MKGKKTGGREKGTPNKTTLEVREAASELIDDPAYRKNLAKRLKAGKAAPAVEALMWHYAKGKPVERHEVGGPGSFDGLTDAEIKEKLAAVIALL